MTVPMLRNLLGIAVVATVLLAPVRTFAQQSPTLGEIARKEEQRRKALKAAPGKVLTNKDLPRTTAPAPPPAAAEAVPEGQPEQAPAKVEEPVQDEATWRQRMTQAREELRRNEMFAEALQTRVNALTNDFASRDDPYQRAKIADDRAKAIVEMERVKADIEVSRKKIADIEEDARRAGVPPGWLR